MTCSLNVSFIAVSLNAAAAYLVQQQLKPLKLLATGWQSWHCGQGIFLTPDNQII